MASLICSILFLPFLQMTKIYLVQCTWISLISFLWITCDSSQPRNFPLNLRLASPHYGKICASSGQWFWKNIFHTYHTSTFVKIFSCVSKHVTHLRSWFGKQFLTKLTIFVLKMSSPHYSYICASSGQWFRNIFSTYITLLRL